jgi:hypothetical protein
VRVEKAVLDDLVTTRWLKTGVCRSAACLAWTSRAKIAGGAIT